MSHQTPHIRRGFTLVELLVVIAIIGVLVAHVAAGHSGRPRSGAAHVLQQQSENLGIAILNFHDSHKKLPSSNRAAGVTNAPRYCLGDADAAVSSKSRTSTTSTTSSPTGASPPPWRQEYSELSDRRSARGCPFSSAPRSQKTTASTATCSTGRRASPTGKPASAPRRPTTCRSTRSNSAGRFTRQCAQTSSTRASATSTACMLRNTDVHAPASARRHVAHDPAGRIALAAPTSIATASAIGDLPTNRVNGGGWCRPASEIGLDGSSNDGTTFPGPCAVNCTNGEDYLKGGIGRQGHRAADLLRHQRHQRDLCVSSRRSERPVRRWLRAFHQ